MVSEEPVFSHLESLESEDNESFYSQLQSQVADDDTLKVRDSGNPTYDHSDSKCEYFTKVLVPHREVTFRRYRDDYRKT